MSTVAQHIDNCVSAGFLKRVPNTARSLEIVPYEEHLETTRLFCQKLAELKQKLEEGGEELSESRIKSINDDIIVLRSAGKILGLDLKL